MIEESIFQIAEQINQLYKMAYDTYLPLVDEICRGEVSEKELSYLFDYLLGFACNEKCWFCIKGCAGDICIHIRIVSNFALKHIGICGKIKKRNVKTIF